MKEKVQHKINKMLELAKSRPMVAAQHKVDFVAPLNDSLSKAIRNPQEAKIFLAELDAVIAAAHK